MSARFSFPPSKDLQQLDEVPKTWTSSLCSRLLSLYPSIFSSAGLMIPPSSLVLSPCLRRRRPPPFISLPVTRWFLWPKKITILRQSLHFLQLIPLPRAPEHIFGSHSTHWFNETLSKVRRHYQPLTTFIWSRPQWICHFPGAKKLQTAELFEFSRCN